MNQAAPEHSTSLNVAASIDHVYTVAVTVLTERGFELEMAERESGYLRATRPYGTTGCTLVGNCVNETMLVTLRPIIQLPATDEPEESTECTLVISPRNEKVLPSGQRTTSGMAMTGRLVELARQLANSIKTAAETR
jgi:hypothetical protein